MINSQTWKKFSKYSEKIGIKTEYKFDYSVFDFFLPIELNTIPLYYNTHAQSLIYIWFH